MSEVILVTGGGRGIGAAVAIGAAAAGYDVCVNYLRDTERAAGVVAAIEKHGRRALAYRADVACEEDVVAMFESIDKELGPVTALVNCAGTNGVQGRLDALAGEDVARLFEANVHGTIFCAREAIRRMSTRFGGRGGSIVTFSSAAARLGGAGRNVHYAASKGAINSLTIGLAQEVASEGIRVNAVSPGVIDTEMQPPGRVAEIGPKLPMGRAGRAEEVASAVLWLLSREASYVSGSILDVSGAR